MLSNSSVLNAISNFWGKKIFIFLFLLNLLTNSTVLLSYNSFDFLWKWFVISALFAAVEGIVYHLFKRIHLHNAFLILVVFFHITLSIVDIFLYYNFNFLFGQDAVDIIAQTTTTEAKSFLSTYLTVPFVFCLTALTLIALYLLKLIATKLANKKIVSLGFVLLALIGLIVYGLTIVNFVLYHNGQAVPQLHSFTRAAYSSKVLFDRNKQISTLQEINGALKATMPAPDQQVGTIIVIVGESFSSYHSSLYGYSKETNPLLAKRAVDGSLTVFSDAVTFSDHTEVAMCSVFPLNRQPDQYFTAPLFPACFKAAGYHTEMFDNQYFIGKGITFLTDAKLSTQMFDYRNNKGYGYDGEILQDLHLSNEPQLIVLHLQGQHYTYSERYPQEFSRFKPQDYTNLTEDQKALVAHYDNATLYNDYVIDQIIERVKYKDCIIVYFSDHGEELYEVDDYIGHGNAAFRYDPTFQMKVPLFVWTSETFNSKHNDIAKRIKEAADKPVMTSDVPHFLIDMANLHTDQFVPELSFINDKYKIRNRIILNTIDYDAVVSKQKSKTRYE